MLNAVSLKNIPKIMVKSPFSNFITLRTLQMLVVFPSYPPDVYRQGRQIGSNVEGISEKWARIMQKGDCHSRLVGSRKYDSNIEPL